METAWARAEPACYFTRTVPIWRGGPDQLFDGFLRSVLHTTNTYISERDAYPHKSMGYWLSDAPLVKWHDAEDRPCYRYATPATELITDYTGFAKQVFTIPAQTLVHVALHPWWKPANTYARKEDSRVERRCYLSISGWYLENESTPARE